MQAFKLVRQAVPARIKSTQEMTQTFFVRFGQEIAAVMFAHDVHSRHQSFGVRNIPLEFVLRHPKIFVHNTALTRLTMRNQIHNHATTLVRNEINNRLIDARVSPWRTVLRRAHHSFHPVLLRGGDEPTSTSRQPLGKPTLFTRLIQRNTRYEQPVNTGLSDAAALGKGEYGTHDGQPDGVIGRHASRPVGYVRRSSQAAEVDESRKPSSFKQIQDSTDSADALPPFRNREVRQRSTIDSIDLNTLTDRVVNAIDRRIVAQRERLGRW